MGLHLKKGVFGRKRMLVYAYNFAPGTDVESPAGRRLGAKGPTLLVLRRVVPTY